MAGPYTLVGSGLQAIATPRALKVEVLAGGSSLAAGAANPRNLFHVGLLRWGNANGYVSPVPIDADVQQLFLPPGMTTLGYKLGPGAQIRVTEVLGIPTDLWDRRVAVVNVRQAQYIANSSAPVATRMFLVPAGVSLCALRLSTRLHAATGLPAGSLAESMVTVGGVPLVDAIMWGNTAGTIVEDQVAADHVLVASGVEVACTVSNNFASGQVFQMASLYGFTFS